MNCLYITLVFNIVAGIVQTSIKSWNQLLYPRVIEVCRQPLETRNDFFLHIIVVEIFPSLLGFRSLVKTPCFISSHNGVQKFISFLCFHLLRWEIVWRNAPRIWRDFGSALPFQTRFTQTKPVLPLSNEHGSQVKDQGRRQCCHNKHNKFPYRPTRDVFLLSRHASYICHIYFTARDIRQWSRTFLQHTTPTFRRKVATFLPWRWRQYFLRNVGTHILGWSDLISTLKTETVFSLRLRCQCHCLPNSRATTPPTLHRVSTPCFSGRHPAGVIRAAPSSKDMTDKSLSHFALHFFFALFFLLFVYHPISLERRFLGLTTSVVQVAVYKHVLCQVKDVG